LKQRHKIVEKNFEVEYIIFGDGERVLLAFHGFNNRSEDFLPLGQGLHGKFRIVSVNIFFHGESVASDELVEKGMSDGDLRHLFHTLMNIVPAESYYLMGFSLGGRIAIKLAELLPKKVAQLYLLSPDGIRPAPIYNFLTQTWIGRSLFRHSVYHPSSYMALGNLLKAMRIVSAKRINLVKNNFDTKEKRERVFKTWLLLRNAYVRPKKLNKLIRKFQLRTTFFFGEHDAIIPKRLADKFVSKKDDLVSIEVMKTGHMLLREKTLLEISRRILEAEK